MATRKARPRAGTPPTTRGARRAHWQALVAAQERSGLSLAAFCRQRGLRKGTLSFWRWKFARDARSGARAMPPVTSTPPSFVPIQLAPGLVAPRPASGGEVEIALGPRRSVRVRGPVEPGWLTTVLRAVEALGC